MKSIVFIVLSAICLIAEDNFICETEYVINAGKKFLPSENLKRITINISEDRNRLTFQTQNMNSIYYYKSFIQPTKQIPSIGVSFEDNGRFVDMFNNNLLYFGFIESGHMIKAHCPNMNLNLREVSVNSSGNIVYGFPHSNITSIPQTKVVNDFSKTKKIAPFTIETSSGMNYFVKLKDAYSNQTIMEFFIKGRDKISIKVPLGTYKIVYASGEKWYGYSKLFGDGTIYTKTDQDFTFQETYQGVSGYTITLYRVSNGNLRTSYINKSQF